MTSVYCVSFIWTVFVIVSATDPPETELPPQPAVLRVTSRTDSVIVMWEPPQHEPHIMIRGYSLDYGDESFHMVHRVQLGADTHEYTIQNLEPDTTYRISIRAFNNMGYGTPLLKSVTTLDRIETEIPLQPEELRVVSRTDSVTVLWAPPQPESNIMVRGYSLEYGDGSFYTTHQVELGANTHEFTIQNLEPDTTYYIAIRAFNNMGRSPAKYKSVTTRDRVATDLSAPMMPPVGLQAFELTPSSVLLTWADSSLGRNQEIRAGRIYTVKIRNLSDRTQSPDYVNSTELNAKVEGLESNTRYEFSVKVAEGQRESMWGMDVRTTTPESTQ